MRSRHERARLTHNHYRNAAILARLSRHTPDAEESIRVYDTLFHRQSGIYCVPQDTLWDNTMSSTNWKYTMYCTIIRGRPSHSHSQYA